MALDEKRWASLTLAEQMANIGSEVGRTAKWMAKGRVDFAYGAYVRALELQDLTLKYGRLGKDGRREMLMELCRARDCFTEAYLNSDLKTLGFLDKYFAQFAHICRR